MYNTNAYLVTFSFLSAVELLPQTTDTTELLKPISQSSETSFYIFLLTAVERPSGTPDWEAVPQVKDFEYLRVLLKSWGRTE